MGELGNTRFFRAVVNEEGDSGIWPARWKVPSGWRADAFTGNIECCAEYLGLLTAGWQHAGRQPPSGGDRLVEQLASAARAYRDEPALRDHGVRLTYHDLYRAASSFAEHLTAAGVAATDRVVVLLEPTADVVVSLMGTLVAGATCVPVCVTEYPEQRGTVIEAARPVALVGEADAVDGAWPSITVLDSSLWRSATATGDAGTTASGGAGIGAEPGSRTAAEAARHREAAFWIVSRHMAETGATAMVWRHRQLATLAGECGLPQIGPGNQVALTALPDSALAVVQILHGLLSGAELVADRARWDTGSAAGAMRLTLSPSQLPGSCRVRAATVGTPPGAAAVELLGSAETAMMSAAVRPDGRLSAIPGRRLYVLDEYLRPVGDGQPGRLHVAGAGIASGYVGRPGLTVRRFLPDPVAGAGARMFRTDVTARRLPDGNIAVAT